MRLPPPRRWGDGARLPAQLSARGELESEPRGPDPRAEPQSEARSHRGLLQRAPTGGLPGAGLLAKPSGRLVWKREVVCAKPGPRGTGRGISARHRASPGLSSLGKERHTHRVVGRGKWGVMTRAQTVPGSCGIRLMWNPARRAPPSTTVSAGGLLAAPPGPREYLLHEKWQMSQIRPSL